MLLKIIVLNPIFTSSVCEMLRKYNSLYRICSLLLCIILARHLMFPQPSNYAWSPPAGIRRAYPDKLFNGSSFCFLTLPTRTNFLDFWHIRHNRLKLHRNPNSESAVSRRKFCLLTSNDFMPTTLLIRTSKRRMNATYFSAPT